jgi:Domain of unknown function (DUF6471)
VNLDAVVTGHKNGKSVFLSDELRPAYAFKIVDGFEHTYMWAAIQLSFPASSATRLPNCLAVSRSPLRGASSTEARLPARLRERRHQGRERAVTFLKAKLKESEVTYVELAKRLKKHGFAETEASITNKLKTQDVFRDVLSGLSCGDGTRGSSLEEI